MAESKFTNQTSLALDEMNFMDFYITEDDSFRNDSYSILDSTSLEDDSENLERYLIQIDDHNVPMI